MCVCVCLFARVCVCVCVCVRVCNARRRFLELVSRFGEVKPHNPCQGLSHLNRRPHTYHFNKDERKKKLNNSLRWKYINPK